VRNDKRISHEGFLKAFQFGLQIGLTLTLLGCIPRAMEAKMSETGKECYVNNNFYTNCC